MATQDDIGIGADALREYVEAVDGWEAVLVSWGTYEQGAQIILDTFDKTKNVAACGATLYKTISDAGYGSQVTSAQCASGAAAVLKATRNT